MSKHSIASVRSHLSELIDEAGRKGAVEITRRGKRVAVLVSEREYDKLKTGRPGLVDAVRQCRERHADALATMTDEDFVLPERTGFGRKSPWPRK